jgi:hypothetical protein
VIEVGLLHRPPLAAAMCLAAHGLSVWARSAHSRSANTGPGRPSQRLVRVRRRRRHGRVGLRDETRDTTALFPEE